MKNAVHFREDARNALNGNWASAVGTTFVASLLGGSVLMDGTGGGSITNVVSQKEEQIREAVVNVPMNLVVIITAVVLAVVGVLAIWSLVQLIVGGFVSLGLIQYNMDLIDGKEVSFGTIFSKSALFGKALWLRIRMAIFTFLWTLLLIVPGIIKSFSYSMAGFIMAENPEISAKEAMRVSEEMMRGNKWRLFCLSFSFIGWNILACLSLGIGYLWLTPYMNAATASFYDEISRERI